MAWYMPPVETARAICGFLKWDPGQGRALFPDRGESVFRAGWVFEAGGKEATISVIADPSRRKLRAEILSGDEVIHLEHGHNPSNSLNADCHFGPLFGTDLPLQALWRFHSPDGPNQEKGDWIRAELFINDSRGILIDLSRRSRGGRIKGRVFQRKLVPSGRVDKSRGYEITFDSPPVMEGGLSLRLDDRFKYRGGNALHPIAHFLGLDGPCGSLLVHPPLHPGKTEIGAWDVSAAMEAILLSGVTLLSEEGSQLPVLRSPIERFCHPDFSKQLGS